MINASLSLTTQNSYTELNASVAAGALAIFADANLAWSIAPSHVKPTNVSSQSTNYPRGLTLYCKRPESKGLNMTARFPVCSPVTTRCEKDDIHVYMCVCVRRMDEQEKEPYRNGA